MHWIKPTHLRTLGQRMAIAIFKMATQEDANLIIERGLFIEGKKVWGRKQIQELRRCLKCQCFGEHKAIECQSIHNVCGWCRSHHWTSSCRESDKDLHTCSNCLVAKNNRQTGQRAVDRRCPIFLLRLEKMNKTRNESKYKYYCTSNPVTWETFSTGALDTRIADGNVTGIGIQEEGRAYGRFGGRRRGEGGEAQRIPDRGWEGRKAGMGMVRNKAISNKQTENHKQSNVFGVRSTIRDKVMEGSHQQGGRKYKQVAQKDTGVYQTTLNEFWKEKEKDMHPWSEEMEELDELEGMQAKNSQESTLSYV